MTQHLYRLRSLERLLDHGELENQEIYFAEPEQLNDPMEGFRDIIWRGDVILWSNLFRHYVLCLERACCLLAICGEDYPFGWGEIPVIDHLDIAITPEQRSRHDELLAAFFGDKHIDALLQALAARGFPVRRGELAAYLHSIHGFVLFKIQQNHVKHGLRQTPRPIPEELVDLSGLRDLIEQIARYEAENDRPEKLIDAIFATRSQINSDLSLIFQYNNRSDGKRFNWQFVFLSFSEEYVKQIEAIMYPEWYAACFMRECRNSSLWGSYGVNHTGVCLKFKVKTVNERLTLRLRRQNGWGPSGPTAGNVDHEFLPVSYENELSPIDFFRSLGRPRVATLKKCWFADRAGNVSPHADEIFNSEPAWRERYWKSFHPAITRKSKDWQYEQEYRLILTGMTFDFSTPSSRTARYDFNDLAGIIFGIKTPIDQKLRICKILEEKCLATKREDFKFYQAHYSHAGGTIEHAEMSLLKFTPE